MCGHEGSSCVDWSPGTETHGESLEAIGTLSFLRMDFSVVCVSLVHGGKVFANLSVLNFSH